MSSCWGRSGRGQHTLPSASPVSQHLMRLRAEGLVRSTRHGKHVTNTLGRADIIPVIATLRAAFCAAPCADPAAPQNPA